jgi:RimJ/RimL family protein N-acetyltransferase
VTKARSTRPVVTVRRATARDVEQIAANTQSVADEGRYIWTEKVTEEWKEFLRKKLIKDRGCLVVVAEVGRGRGRKVVGDLTMTRYGQTIRKSQHVRVLAMLIVEGYREMGIGSRMMDYALKWARGQPGVEKVVLGVFSNNERALRLYEKFGFEVEGVRRKHYYIDGKHEDEVDMALFVK